MKTIIACCDHMNLQPIGESFIDDGHAWRIFKCLSCRHMYIKGFGLDPLKRREVLKRVVLDTNTNKYRIIDRETKGNIYADN